MAVKIIMHLCIPHVLYKTGRKEFFQLSFICTYRKNVFSPESHQK